MSIIQLQGEGLRARISTRGGIVLGLWQDGGAQPIPLLRAAPDDNADALSSGCYPLVPFGNRVRDNRFRFEEHEYGFRPNTDWDRHYLHGEGWQAQWAILRQDATSVDLSFEHKADDGTPYSYRAQQRFALADGGFSLHLSVTNLGERPMPFGLGWHPYFPMTPRTTLLAPARKYWTEVQEWLPGEATAIPADVDFSEPRELPHRWVNNGFEDWAGEALISWPEHRIALHLTADPLFRHAFVFVSDTGFDPAFKRDYFCLEPMSHLADGHNMQGLGDLKVLAHGEMLAGGIKMTPGTI